MSADKKSPILVVDDEDDARNVMKSYLEKRGYAVLTAADGEEGLTQLMSGAGVEIVLCDITMPKLDGLGFLKQARQYNPNIEVILITGQSTVERCVDAVEHGACQYLTKPVKLEEVLASIERAKRNIDERQEMISRALKNRKNG